MRTAATSARTKYMQYLESERSKEKTETKQLKRKALEEEIGIKRSVRINFDGQYHQGFCKKMRQNGKKTNPTSKLKQQWVKQ
ncbi:hypothetical protein AVEN_245842-1 [Araneus ventricosus]|uniref:Uncharacterized protein n=1 Tax=Araneus ventricosus TaxID=182803 RepID=A0A4Y2E8J4_ARAVE|nr:hypothetical protein AVEN_245842-1 [Araneus ventricosus]